MGSPTLLVRADANVAIGTGHVMRCLALSQAWQDLGGASVFAMAQSTPAIEERLRSERIDVSQLDAPVGSSRDAAQLAELSRACGADWVVLDGYQFDSDYQRDLRDAGRKLLFIDDNGHAAHYFSDLVLNHNAHACDDLFRSRESHTRLLLGPRYSLLRREFEAWRDWKREITPVGRKVLVTMGGSDPDNVTAAVIRALSLIKIRGLEVTVVVGGSNPHMDSLESAAAGIGGAVRLHRSASNMPELLAWADVAVSGAGTTCWEICLLGLPSILIELAENQRLVARELGRRGAAIHLGNTENVSSEKIAAKLEWLLLSPEQRAALSRRARELVDGKGARRVVSAMRGDVQLRRAQEDDCRLLWEWANDPAARAASFSRETIPWEQHREWFRSKLTDPRTLLYLALDSSRRPVGQIRYEIKGSQAAVSISLAPHSRDLGYGYSVLAKGIDEVFRSTATTAIDAYVKPDNEASIRLFTRAGFSTASHETIRGQDAVHFALKKNGRS